MKPSRPSNDEKDAAEQGRMRERDRPTRPMLMVASFAIVIAVFAGIWIVNGLRAPPESARPGGPFNAETTDRAELRRVTEAVSRIISATPAQHEAAVETLESVRADSPGARDLKDSCVNTYRGLIRAEQLMEQVRRIEGAPDGGVRPASEIPPADRTRALQIHEQAREQIEIVAQSRNRCMDLYAQAAESLRMQPARRPENPPR